jgi:hypothetical protein
MRILSPRLRFTLFCSLAFIAVVRGGGTAAVTTRTAAVPALQTAPFPDAFGAFTRFSKPTLFAVDYYKRELEYWPITPGLHPKPTLLPGLDHLGNPGGLAANGSRIAMATGSGVLVVDVAAGTETMLPPADGYPLDVAIDKHGAVYLVSIFGHTANGGLTIYEPSKPPREVRCSLMQYAETVAVDNEGNVFLNQSGGTTAGIGVIEIPNGPGGPDGANCKKLDLRPAEHGYAAGIAIDPKTDDLLVLSDPDYCAGGIEGRLTTFSKPYERAAGRSLNLGRNCSGTLRLDATSSIVFIGDEGVAGPPTFILQYRYPDGKPLGAFGGGEPGGFITIPNRLPN